uniref:AAA+ ATPase domain-containing protein n=1 Tax=viral metagenome TaxID=1070528 RepID=A0A6C0K0Q4_9ZZZZ
MQLYYIVYITTIFSFFLHSNAFIFPYTACSRSSFCLNTYNRQYGLSKYGKEHYLKKLNSSNVTEREEHMFSESGYRPHAPSEIDDLLSLFNGTSNKNLTVSGLQIIFNPGMFDFQEDGEESDEGDDEEPEPEKDENYRPRRRFGYSSLGRSSSQDKKSENFQVVTNSGITFSDVGGYDSIKSELYQCIDLLQNHTKYAGYNVRIPRGLVFEGPPGNGKTLLAKALAGEARTSFISVSGSEFQEKYVGVGPARIRELFGLAKKNIPCIIFIDEIDALGRKRSSDGESSSSERDSTLNELLVAMDGFKNTTGIFVIGATNRADLLDPALMRPGRIDKRVYIANPDRKTRNAILNIHLRGKPRDATVHIDDLVEITDGLSSAQIENLVNEAMLNALKNDKKYFTSTDIENVMNRILVGWQPSEHQFTSNIIDIIAIHEMGHAVVGLLSKHHSKMTKVIINLSAPKSPGYTVFEASSTTILTREALFEHLMILLAGRIAEEIFYDVSVTTGAINDFEEALKLAEKMVVYYGMGKNIIYPNMSEKYKELIDIEVEKLINDAYIYSDFLLRNSKDYIYEASELLKREKIVKAETLLELMQQKYPNVFNLSTDHID